MSDEKETLLADIPLLAECIEKIYSQNLVLNYLTFLEPARWVCFLSKNGKKFGVGEGKTPGRALEKGLEGQKIISGQILEGKFSIEDF